MYKVIRIVCLFFIIGCLLLGEASSVAAIIYRWRDEKGQIHYSTTLPTNPPGVIEVKRNNQWYPYDGNEVFAPPEKAEKSPISYTTSSPGSGGNEPDSPDRLYSPTSQATVSYSKRNAAIIIQATINRTLTKPFIVDTGASITLISPEVANALYLIPDPGIPQITVQGVGGQIQVPLVNLDSITVGGLETLNITAAIHDFDEHVAAGLLGLNFLNRFQITVDSEHSQLILTPIRPLSGYASDLNCVGAREFFNRGIALNDNAERKAEYYQKALSLCPDLPNLSEAYHRLVASCYQQKDYQRAIDLYLKFVSIKPTDPEVHYRLGVLYMLERNFSQAKNALKKALELNPGHQQAREYLEQLKNYQ